MREFIRHPTSIPIQLMKQDGDTKPRINTLNAVNALNNVSFGGVSCFCPEPFENGCPVKMTIKCIDPSFEINGKVIWCRLNNTLYEVGIEFLVSEDKMFLLRMVEQICHIEHYRNELLHNEGREITSEVAAMEWVEKYADGFPKL